jgi:hypothetical protein
VNACAQLAVSCAAAPVWIAPRRSRPQKDLNWRASPARSTAALVGRQAASIARGQRRGGRGLPLGQPASSVWLVFRARPRPNGRVEVCVAPGRPPLRRVQPSAEAAERHTYDLAGHPVWPPAHRRHRPGRGEFGLMPTRPASAKPPGCQRCAGAQ